ncbi:hypothetical protein BpHYR1_025207 [Brachionus plicatilis]|uniref:Uncharacterized protein n=1 Tax=Brachionus plicatilis TaxID=10195 RepID=A0A3M7PLH0_BRAPC|nr:hypothetical protein BpHYR1_025207 [Brachionus plicatilis]
MMELMKCLKLYSENSKSGWFKISSLFLDVLFKICSRMLIPILGSKLLKNSQLKWTSPSHQIKI